MPQHPKRLRRQRRSGYEPARVAAGTGSHYLIISGPPQTTPPTGGIGNPALLNVDAGMTDAPIDAGFWNGKFVPRGKNGKAWVAFTESSGVKIGKNAKHLAPMRTKIEKDPHNANRWNLTIVARPTQVSQPGTEVVWQGTRTGATAVGVYDWTAGSEPTSRTPKLEIRVAR